MRHIWVKSVGRRRRSVKCKRRFCGETRVAMPVAESAKIREVFGPMFADTGPCREKVSGGIAADNARR